MNVNNCLAVGNVNIPNGTNIGGLLAGNGAWYTIVTVENSYTTNAPFYAYETGGANTEFAKWNVSDYVKERNYLAITEISTLFPNSTAWQKDILNNGVDRGTPILKYFATWWTGRNSATN